ncbi:MAG: hypothetical protein K8J09_04880 [Planctomycetes bacterium]|nr:hypothetical protein [Planctomycetota bacterium]MCC7396729.1 hypothetical protein [Planctomycetota bacterium]
MTAHPDELRARAAHLRSVAARWGAELRATPIPRPRRGRIDADRHRALRAYHERRDDIASVIEFAADLEAQASAIVAQHATAALTGTTQDRAVQLRTAGLSFGAIADVLCIPIGSAKTWCRRARLAGRAA